MKKKAKLESKDKVTEWVALSLTLNEQKLLTHHYFLFQMVSG